MKGKHIKTNYSGRLRKTPGKLKSFLAERVPSAPIPQKIFDLAAVRSSYASIGAEPDYSTETSDHRVVKGYETVQFGAGSGGGYLLRALGLAELVHNLIDPKEVEVKHTIGARTIYTEREIGMLKVDAARYLIERDFPGTKVNPLPYDVAEIPDHTLKNLLSRVLLAIIAIDDPEQILRINDLGYGLTEIIQVACHRKAESGHVAISIPHVTACLRCTLDISEDRQIRRLDSESASSIDIMTISHLGAKVALELMIAKATGRPIQQWDSTKNLLYIANTRQTLSPNGPKLTWEETHKRKNCPICNG